MAGPGGFEPPSAGIKTRCLNRLATALLCRCRAANRPRHPPSRPRRSGGGYRAPPARQPAKSYNGEAFLPFTTNPDMPFGSRSASSRASASVPKAVNTQLPVPLILAR